MTFKSESSYPIWFHGRQLGRRLSTAQRAYLEEGMAQFAVPQTGALDFPRLFEKNYRKYMLEIGFGNGEHLIALAQAQPDCGIIGCEPYINGLAGVCRNLLKNNIPNLRLYADDVASLLPLCPKEDWRVSIFSFQTHGQKSAIINDGYSQFLFCKRSPRCWREKGR